MRNDHLSLGDGDKVPLVVISESIVGNVESQSEDRHRSTRCTFVTLDKTASDSDGKAKKTQLWNPQVER